MPAVADETVSVAVPLVVMLPGLTEQVNPAEQLVVSVTVPAKPLIGETVIEEVAEAPALTIMDVGLAVIVKSVTATVTVAE